MTVLECLCQVRDDIDCGGVTPVPGFLTPSERRADVEAAIALAEMGRMVGELDAA